MVAVVVLDDNCHRNEAIEGEAEIFHFGGLVDSDGGWGRQHMLHGYVSTTSSEMQLTARGVVIDLMRESAAGVLQKIFISKKHFERTFRELFVEMGFEHTFEAADLSDPNIKCSDPEKHTA